MIREVSVYILYLYVLFSCFFVRKRIMTSSQPEPSRVRRRPVSGLASRSAPASRAELHSGLTSPVMRPRRPHASRGAAVPARRGVSEALRSLGHSSRNAREKWSVSGLRR